MRSRSHRARSLCSQFFFPPIQPRIATSIPLFRRMTTVVRIDRASIAFEGTRVACSDEASRRALQQAAQTLRANDVVAFPTETVYGLGANCQSTDAVAKIYAAKNRPSDNPLIVHVSSRRQVETVLKTPIPPIYDELIAKFWPGPLTILLPLPENTPISPLCTKNQHTFGCRMPKHPVARALIEESGLPLAAPSANASTKPSPTEAKHVLEDMDGRIPLIIDGGPADVGVESTVVDGLVSPPRVLRPGGVSIEEIRAHGGSQWADTVAEGARGVSAPSAPRAPGMKYKHYSPKARVIAVAPRVSMAKLSGLQPAKVAVLTSLQLGPENFTGIWPQAALLDLPLGRTKQEVSHNLFSRFREADLAGCDLIVVEAVDTADEGLAIMNRLNKAAEMYIE